MLGHTPDNRGRFGAYSRARAAYARAAYAQAAYARAAYAQAAGPATGQPWRIQLSGGSDPAGTDSAGGWCWQSHQVPPGQSS